jgi:hypothetical protein
MGKAIRMILERLITDVFFLELIRLAIFIGGFVFSTSYLLPKGVLFFLEWKEKKEYRKLCASMVFCAGGISINSMLGVSYSKISASFSAVLREQNCSAMINKANL